MLTGFARKFAALSLSHAAVKVGSRIGLASLALLAAAAALNAVTPRSAEPFSGTRLAGNHAGMYGAPELAGDDIRHLLERALP